MAGLIFLFIGLFFYFIPAINAYSKKKRNKSAVLVLNLFLGWTIIGWVVALIWSTTKDAEPQVVVTPASTHSEADELAKLADLKAKGVISEEEFLAKKKKILGL